MASRWPRSSSIAALPPLSRRARTRIAIPIAARPTTEDFSRSVLVSALIGLIAFTGAGCGPATPAADGDAQAEPDVVRTADPTLRGLNEDEFPRVQELAPGVYSYEQLRSAGDERFTTVSLFVVTDAGVLVADGQGNVEETQRLVDTIATITDAPITHVVVCSDHGDHTGGNSAFPEDATFFAHPTSAALLSGGSGRGGRGGAGGNGAQEARSFTYEMVPDQRILDIGGKQIQILFLGRAHTGGDLMVYLPAEKILFMSEAYLNRVFPAMRSAYPSEWLGVLDSARAMDVEIFVPGHGFVESPRVLAEELAEYRRALAQVIEEATRLHAAGLSVEDAIEQADFGDLETWSLRASQGPTAIRRVYAELEGELR